MFDFQCDQLYHDFTGTDRRAAELRVYSFSERSAAPSPACCSLMNSWSTRATWVHLVTSTSFEWSGSSVCSSGDSDLIEHCEHNRLNVFGKCKPADKRYRYGKRKHTRTLWQTSSEWSMASSCGLYLNGCVPDLSLQTANTPGAADMWCDDKDKACFCFYASSLSLSGKSQHQQPPRYYNK